MKRNEFVDTLTTIIDRLTEVETPSEDIANYITNYSEYRSVIKLDDVLTDESIVKKYIDKLCERLCEFTDFDEYTICQTFWHSKDINEFMRDITECEGEDARYFYEVYKRIEDIADDYAMAKEEQINNP